jgi:hypothetical protein
MEGEGLTGGGRQHGFPAAPPPEVLDALDTAAVVLDELRRSGILLRLNVGQGVAGPSVSARAVRADGHVVGDLQPRDLLEVLGGLVPWDSGAGSSD